MSLEHVVPVRGTEPATEVGGAALGVARRLHQHQRPTVENGGDIGEVALADQGADPVIAVGAQPQPHRHRRRIGETERVEHRGLVVAGDCEPVVAVERLRHLVRNLDPDQAADQRLVGGVERVPTADVGKCGQRVPPVRHRRPADLPKGRHHARTHHGNGARSATGHVPDRVGEHGQQYGQVLLPLGAQAREGPAGHVAYIPARVTQQRQAPVAVRHPQTPQGLAEDPLYGPVVGGRERRHQRPECRFADSVQHCDARLADRGAALDARRRHQRPHRLRPHRDQRIGGNPPPAGITVTEHLDHRGRIHRAAPYPLGSGRRGPRSIRPAGFARAEVDLITRTVRTIRT